MPSLAQYLLHLADDPKAEEQHKRSREDAVKQMTDFGLTEKQQETMLSEDRNRIQSEANKELRERPGGGKAVSLSVNAEFIG